jgi:hypothetical protein
MADRAAKLRAIIERSTTPLGERTAALRALANLEPTAPASLAQAIPPERAAQYGYPGRWEDDAREQPVLVFDVARAVAPDFITGEGVLVAAPGGYVVECRVQGVRLRPRYEPSQVIARVVGLAAAPVAALG